MFEFPSAVYSGISHYLFDSCVCVCDSPSSTFPPNFQDTFHKNKCFISAALILYLLSVERNHILTITVSLVGIKETDSSLVYNTKGATRA